jgi:predicted naringenin-chalcone synthase
MIRFVLQHMADTDGEPRRDRDAQERLVRRLFQASHVGTRQLAIDVDDFYSRPRGTGERMATYQKVGYKLARPALEACFAEMRHVRSPADVTDLFLVSCTGYAAPGLDISLSRDLGIAHDARRVVIGHMGCFGAMVGLRQSLSAVRADPQATALMLSLELSSLHFEPTEDIEVLTECALFGDAAAALMLTNTDERDGPELVDTYCAADFDAADQMSWTITDTRFEMGLSPRVPVTLRRNLGDVVDRLLAPHGLRPSDITHWLAHPGGPSILEVIQKKFELSDEQMETSWRILRDHGNCSSATILLILEDYIRSQRAKPGEWGVMMAFGPGLTLETALIRF